MRDILPVFNEIVSELVDEEDEQPVADIVLTGDLHDKLNLTLENAPMGADEFKKVLKDLVLSTPRTATRSFFNQLYGGRNDNAILGDLLAAVLNNSMYTYKVAGPQVGVEKEVLSKVCETINWGEEAGGTFASGGSISNLMGMLMARDQFDNSIPNKGLNHNLIVYTSKESHYSIVKNASFTGIGRENVRKIRTNENGQMDVQALELAIEEDRALGKTPLMVFATAGTTVLGAFDPIDELADVCEKESLWLHVDGAYCGSVIFSTKYKHLIKGVERSDSFSLNAHKMLGTPLTCSLILVKNKEHLKESFTNEAEYLYQTDDDEFNLGKTSMQCGRRNDALKLWTLWKRVGTVGLEMIVDRQFELADIARDHIRKDPNYQLYSFDDSLSICFNYKNISANTVCTELYEQGKLMVGYGAFGQDEFVRMVTINAQNEPADILNFFKQLEEHVWSKETSKDKIISAAS